MYYPLSETTQQQFERHLVRGTIATSSSFRWIEDEDIVAAFKLINPAVKLPSWRKLGGSILKRESTQTKEQIENIAKEDKIGVTLAFDGWKNIVKQKLMGTMLITSQGKTLVWKAEDISAERTRAIEINAFTERYIEDLLVKQIIPICVVSDSAGENVKSRYMLHMYLNFFSN